MICAKKKYVVINVEDFFARETDEHIAEILIVGSHAWEAVSQKGATKLVFIIKQLVSNYYG